MTHFTLPRAALTAGATLLAASGVLLTGCGSSSGGASSTTATRAAAAAPREVTLTPADAGTPVTKQQVSSAVGETVVYSVSCNTASTGQVWKSGRIAPVITRKSTSVSVPADCVTPEGAAPGAAGVRKWAFEATAPGTETISFRLWSAGTDAKLVKRAVVVLTVTQ